MDATAPKTTVLVAKAGKTICAFPLANVIETMRPLQASPLPDVPSFVRGVSIIRGLPTPVVDLGVLIDASDTTNTERFLCVQYHHQRIALAVSKVFGIHHVEMGTWDDLPALLEHSLPEFVQTIGTIDSQLLLVLGASKLLPLELWTRLENSLQDAIPPLHTDADSPGDFGESGSSNA